MIEYISAHIPLFSLIIAFTVLTLFILYKAIFIVGGQQIAVLERRWFGKQMPANRVVAMANEVGIQARILGPGLHILIPLVYKITKHPMMIISEGEVGLVEAIDGQAVPPGRIYAKALGKHNLFQDGEAFLTSESEKGPQIEILPPGTYRINPYLFHIEKQASIQIAENEVGIVVANDGDTITSGQILGKQIQQHNHYQNGAAFLENGGQKGPQIEILLPGTYRINTKLFNVNLTSATVIPAGKVGLVTAETGRPLETAEYVASSVSGHQNYQDGSAFLEHGGQRGPQYDLLKPGTYYVNPLMFKVNLDEVLHVERGGVAVIVSNVGKEPSVEKDVNNSAENKGIERYVVSSGCRGIQREVLGPGIYYLNKLAHTPYIIPTTNITIDWASDKSQESNLQTNRIPRVLDPLSIVSKDGFQMTVEVKVIIRILPEQAPHMLARIGTVDNLIEHVIHPLIDSSFRNQASSSEAMKFMQDRHIEQSKAEEHVAGELAKYHVECVSVLICQIKLPDRLMETMTNKVVASQQMAMYDAQQEAEGRRKEMEKTKAQADSQPNLVKAEIDVQIASQQKQQQIILAEGKSQATKLEQEGVAAGIEAVGRAEAEKTRAIGEATAAAYNHQVESLGQQSLAIIEVMKQVSNGQIKITPDILVNSAAGGSENATSNMLTAFIANMLKNSQSEPQPIFTTKKSDKKVNPVVEPV